MFPNMAILWRRVLGIVGPAGGSCKGAGPFTLRSSGIHIHPGRQGLAQWRCVLAIRLHWPERAMWMCDCPRNGGAPWPEAPASITTSSSSVFYGICGVRAALFQWPDSGTSKAVANETDGLPVRSKGQDPGCFHTRVGFFKQFIWRSLNLADFS